MRKLVMLVLLLVLLAIAGFSCVAFAGNGKGHECKWCHAPTAAATTSPAVSTVTVTTPAAPAQTVTQTVTTPASSQSQSQTQTVIVVHEGVVTKTITKVKTVVKLKKVRRYCTRQRHGWRCGPTAPHQKPLKG